MKTEGLCQKFVRCIIFLVSLYTIAFHVGQFTFARMPSIKFYAMHVMVAIILIFLYYPLDRKIPETRRVVSMICRIVDWAIIILGVVASLYVILNFDVYVDDMQNSVMTNRIIYIFGIILVLIILESARRTLGLALPLIALIAIGYALIAHRIPGLFGNRQLSFKRIIFALFSDRGIYGTPTATCANNVFLFLMFAAFLNASGADRIFQNFAIAIAGRKRGGPAKMAVVGSALFGTISGSCVANVVSTGSFTIPLMKRNGYRSSIAGAIESVASTGGQIMPPIMGAAAFVMSDISGISYATICLGAIIPALMYYICLFKMIDLEAVKYDIKGLDESLIPDLKESMKRSLKLFIPIGILLVLLIGMKKSPMVSAIWSTLAVIICGFLDSKERMTIKNLFDGCIKAGKSLCSVLSACATAGIVVGVFSLTGVGLKFSNLIVRMGGNSLAISLVLSMLVCIILGMGLPTTAAYIVCATVIAPALTTLGLPVFATHMFLLFFASLSAITPPVAVASYAAAGIAKENPMKVGWNSFMLGIAGFILPFAFAYNYDYLLFAFNLTTLITLLSGITVSMCLAIGIQGYIEKKISLPTRALYIVIAVVAITPYRIPSAIAVAIFFALYFIAKRNAKATVSAS